MKSYVDVDSRPKFTVEKDDSMHMTYRGISIFAEDDDPGQQYVCKFSVTNQDDKKEPCEFSGGAYTPLASVAADVSDYIDYLLDIDSYKAENSDA